MTPPKKLSPWICCLINQLAFPGLGTILMGRKAGYAQATLMVAGFLLTVGFFIGWMVADLRYLSHSTWTEAEFKALYQPYLWSLKWGLSLTAAAWLWALCSSLGFLRKES